MVVPTDKGEPLNEDFFMATIPYGDEVVTGLAWKEKGKWYFIPKSHPSNTIFEVDSEDICILFYRNLKEPKYT